MSVSSDPVASVQAFFRAWEDEETIIASYHQWFLPITIWENVGLATTVGAEEAVAFMEQFAASTGMATMSVEIRSLALSGFSVLTERIDRVFDRSGKELFSIPLMGILEVDKGGRIAAWRDYFDVTPLRA